MTELELSEHAKGLVILYLFVSPIVAYWIARIIKRAKQRQGKH